MAETPTSMDLLEVQELSPLPRGTDTVLVADDDISVRKMLQFILKRDGYDVLLAGDGKEAVAITRELRPDIILLDCQMPVMNGFDACREIRADSSFDDTPIIFLTSLSEAREKAKGFEVGGTDYVTKPAYRAELLARIHTHLELAYSRKELRRQAEIREAKMKGQSQRLHQVRSGQASMLVDPDTLHGLNAAVRFEPAYEAGGDFYEIRDFGDGQYGFLVADISGHDLSVAYLTGALKALTANFTSEVLSVDETMFMFNSALLKFLDPGRYASACYAKFSRSLMEVELINAGHPWAMIARREKPIEFIELAGDILGMHDTVTCENIVLPVQFGDRLFLFTDGLTEGYPDDNGKTGSRIHGRQRLCETVDAKRNQPLKNLVNGVVDDLIVECGGTLEDDVVFMGVEF